MRQYMTPFLNKKLLSILTLLFLQTFLFAQTSVWKVQKDEETIYLGGTIHLLRQQDYPLPKEFDIAYTKSDIIYFETDLEALDQPSVQEAILSRMKLTNGKKFSELISKETYEDLRVHALKYGIDVKSFEPFKPAMVMLTLTIMELKNIGVDAQGVDKFYLNKALADNKMLGKLESVDTQIKYLVSIGMGNEDNLISQTLTDLKKLQKYYNRMLSSWRLGSTGSLNKLFVKDMKKRFPKVYKSLLVERNNNWMPIIEEMFENDKTEFVLVGVAHLVGSDGLLKQLKSKGYKIKKLK